MVRLLGGLIAPSNRVARSVVLGLALAAGWAMHAPQAHAQSATDASTNGLRLGIAPITGNFTASAARAFRWDDGEGNTRLYFDGGAVGERVTLYIADYTLEARRASVWLREVSRDAAGNALVEVIESLPARVTSLRCTFATWIRERGDRPMGTGAPNRCARLDTISQTIEGCLPDVRSRSSAALTCARGDVTRLIAWRR